MGIISVDPRLNVTITSVIVSEKYGSKDLIVFGKTDQGLVKIADVRGITENIDQARKNIKKYFGGRIGMTFAINRDHMGTYISPQRIVPYTDTLGSPEITAL